MAVGTNQRAAQFSYPQPVLIYSLVTNDLIWIPGTPSEVPSIPLNENGEDQTSTNGAGINVRTGRRTLDLLPQVDLVFRNTANPDLLALQSGYQWANSSGDSCQTYIFTVPADGTALLGPLGTIGNGFAQDTAIQLWEVPLDGSAPVLLNQVTTAGGIVVPATDYFVDTDFLVTVDATKAGCILVARYDEPAVTLLRRTDTLVGQVGAIIPVRLNDGTTLINKIPRAEIVPQTFLAGAGETVTVSLAPIADAVGSCGTGVEQFIQDEPYVDLCSLV